jgi:hypothetical protein
MQVRKYSSISQDTTLAAGGISSSATTMTVATGTGNSLMGGITLTTGDTFQVAIDPDTTSEELVFITAQSGDVFTITRARAGTSAIVHAAGATVRHVLSSDDLNYFNTTSPASLAVAKGSITVATGNQAVQGLAVGTNDYVLTADSAETTGVKWAAVPSVSLNLTINAKTDNYTLISSDVNKLITMTASTSKTITVPNGVFSAGQQINVAGLGTGLVTIASDGTSVLNATPGLKLRAQYSAATIICTASNTFLVVGDLSA